MRLYKKCQLKYRKNSCGAAGQAQRGQSAPERIKKARNSGLLLGLLSQLLLNNFCDHTGTNSTATFTDRKAQTFVHRNRGNQCH